MHIFQSKNGSRPIFPSQHQPFPLFILELPGAIAARSPSHAPTGAAAQTPLPCPGLGSGGQHGKGKYKVRGASGPESHIPMRPPNFVPLLHPPLSQKHAWV